MVYWKSSENPLMSNCQTLSLRGRITACMRSNIHLVSGEGLIQAVRVMRISLYSSETSRPNRVALSWVRASPCASIRSISLSVKAPSQQAKGRVGDRGGGGGGGCSGG